MRFSKDQAIRIHPLKKCVKGFPDAAAETVEQALVQALSSAAAREEVQTSELMCLRDYTNPCPIGCQYLNLHMCSMGGYSMWQQGIQGLVAGWMDRGDGATCSVRMQSLGAMQCKFDSLIGLQAPLNYQGGFRRYWFEQQVSHWR